MLLNRGLGLFANWHAASSTCDTELYGKRVTPRIARKCSAGSDDRAKTVGWVEKPYQIILKHGVHRHNIVGMGRNWLARFNEKAPAESRVTLTSRNITEKCCCILHRRAGCIRSLL